MSDISHLQTVQRFSWYTTRCGASLMLLFKEFYYQTLLGWKIVFNLPQIYKVSSMFGFDPPSQVIDWLLYSADLFSWSRILKIHVTETMTIYPCFWDGWTMRRPTLQNHVQSHVIPMTWLLSVRNVNNFSNSQHITFVRLKINFHPSRNLSRTIIRPFHIHMKRTIEFVRAYINLIYY